ncbi:MAG: permease prefix domain 1-containing protein [Intestinibacillus sp.]
MPPSKTDAFLAAVCAQIRWPRVRRKIRAELSGHIEDRILYLMEKRGFSFDEAEETAVRNMGDPVALGIALNDQHRAGPFVLCLAITAAFWVAIFYVAYLLLHDLGLI